MRYCAVIYTQPETWTVFLQWGTTKRHFQRDRIARSSRLRMASLGTLVYPHGNAGLR
jgi:hypothetical protein